jgi:cell division protein FtsB
MRPRISMRTVLWLVAIAAILAAWWADRRRLELRHEQAARELNSMTAHAKAIGKELHRMKLHKLQAAMRERAKLSLQENRP